MKTTKVLPEITFVLECPHCGEQLRITEPIQIWVTDCIHDIGYGKVYTDASLNMTITCGECEAEFILDGVQFPDVQ